MNDYSKIFDNNPIAMVLFHMMKDEHGNYSSYKVEYTNKAMKEMLGERADLVVEKVYKDEYPIHKELLMLILSEQKPIHKMMWDSFTEKYLDITAYIAEDSHIVCMVTDISEQYTEEKEKAKLNRKMLDTLPIGVSRYALNEETGEYERIYSNFAAQIINGCEDDLSKEDTGTYGRAKIHPADEEYVSQIFKKMREGEKNISYEYRIIRKDGNYAWIKGTISRMEQPNKNCIYQSVYNDVTKQKEAEAVLRENNTFYYLLVEYTDVNIWQYDILTDTVFHTEKSRKKHNEEMIVPNYTKILHNSSIIREDSKEDFCQLYKEVREGNAVVERDIWFRKNDKKEYWCEHITYVLIENHEGQYDRAIGIGKDITNEINTITEKEKLEIALDYSNLHVWEYDIVNHLSHFQKSRSDEHDNLVGFQGTNQYGEIYPSDISEIYEMYSELEKGTPTVQRDIMMYGPEKQKLWFRIAFKTLFDKNGKPIRAIGWSIDITSLIEEQQRFLEEVEYQREVEKDNLAAKIRFNLSKNVVEEYNAKDYFCVLKENMTYEDSVEILAKTALEEKSADEIRTLMNKERVLNAYKRGDSRYMFEYRRILRNAQIRWARVVVKTFLEPQSGDVKSFVYGYDIDKEKTMQTIVDHIAENDFEMLAILYYKVNREYIVKNSILDRLLQKEENEAVYDKNSQAFIDAYVEEEYKAEAKEKLNKNYILECLQSQNRYSVSFPIHFDGKTLYKKWEYSYLDESKSTIFMTRSDVTELIATQVRQKETLRNALAQAEMANRAKSDFLSRMSHEIRTPMNAIIGMTALAAQNINDPEQVSEYISKVGISARFLLSLINDILDMSRIESGKMTVKNEKFPFEELITGINAIIYEQAETKGIDYDCIISSFTETYYSGDAMKLQQVLVNLLGNAVKFTPKGGKVQLIVRQDRVDNNLAHMTFIVNDTGVGISEDFQKKMFDPFEQEDDTITTRYKGTGLGLAICKNLVSLMNGTISVNSIEDVGSEFTVKVPLKITEDGKQYKRFSLDLNEKKLTTLVVDDDVTICEHTKNILEDLNISAEWVDSGRKAVALVKERWNKNRYFDVVLVDWKMPEMNGIETAGEIRKIVGPDVTIIVMTAYDWAPIEREAKEAGVNLLISKPLFKSSIMSAFEKIYTKKEQERQEIKPEEYDFTGRKVLLVEDHILNIEVAKRLLEYKNAKVEVAENGLIALETFVERPAGYFDVILMDIRMPIMDGLTASRSIRQMKKETAQTIPIVAMSANAFDEDIEKSKAAGMNAHLAKPIEPNLLYYTLNRIFENGIENI